MSPERRAFAVTVMLLHVGTAVFGLVKLARRPAAEVRGRKWVWAVGMVVNLAAGTLVHLGHLTAPRAAHDTAGRG